MRIKSSVSLILVITQVLSAAKINLVDCGVDHDEQVSVGEIDIEQYPWLGIFYYTDDAMEGVRAVTPVALIQENFCLASASDIDAIPKHNFRKKSRVLIGETWDAPGRRVRSYIIHPEIKETHNTLAILYLRDGVRNGVIRHLCPPPDILQDPEFYVVRFQSDYNNLQKEVIPMYYVPPRLCRDFYVATNLYAAKMRPPHVVCACSIEHDEVCIWETGAALVTRDVWGRWLLLGFGVRGPGCSGPSRYLDMASYYPWIHDTLHNFRPLTISKINPHKYVLRATGHPLVPASDAGTTILQGFGQCDEEEMTATSDQPITTLYRDYIQLRTDTAQIQHMTYNLTISQKMEITCMKIELIHASALSELGVRHFCPKDKDAPCYMYATSMIDISVHVTYSGQCVLHIHMYGWIKDLTLIDTLSWRWEEGTYYEDFTMQPVEYRGTPLMTGFG